MNRTYAEVEPTRDEVERWEGPAVIEFGTPWCGACLAAQSLISTALAEYPQVLHLKVEDGRMRRLGRSFRVKLWPTLIFLDNGEEVARLVRPASAGKISEALERLVGNRR